MTLAANVSKIDDGGWRRMYTADYPMPVLDPHALIDDRVQAIVAYHQACGLQRAELDVSGGIDSAVLAGLLVLALGPENLTLVYSSIHSGDASRERAEALVAAIGAKLIVHDLTGVYDAMLVDMRANLEAVGFDREEIDARIETDGRVLGSIRSCLRAPLGRGYLRLTGPGVRHGTGNECEDRWLRFFQKGGDGEVDTNPIAMLSKGEVFQLAKALGERLDAQSAFRAIITVAPTPELWGREHAHTDEEEIGDYLGLTGHGETFYSYIDPDTGSYARVGMIERVARFADSPRGTGLFEDSADEARGEARIGALIDRALDAPAMAGLDENLIAALLRAARRAERASRHKMNPNCPTLGTRADLDMLTDELP